MAALSYESEPGAAFAQIDALRRQGDEASPHAAFTRNAAERQRIAEEVGALLADNPEAAGTFAAGVHAAEVWMASRERCKGNNIRVIHEARMCFRELGRRMAAAGHIADVDQIFMLTEDEVDPFLANPASFTDKLAERETDFRLLADLEPPFIVNGVCPPVTSWPKKDTSAISGLAVGDVLTGVACAAGVATGKARVLTDPYDAGDLEPGDILITYSTDPSWTPLFLAAGAVITDIGAIGSHASIVSRELGIPCVGSVPDATRRIPDGAVLTVDGGQGTVTVVSLP
jgi:rifampicin phosphotransferase